jgi:hypothetical protein
VTRRPVSTKGSFSSPPRKCTYGLMKIFFSLDSLFRGLMELRVKNLGRNSKKNVSVLRGLKRLGKYFSVLSDLLYLSKKSLQSS